MTQTVNLTNQLRWLAPLLALKDGVDAHDRPKQTWEDKRVLYYC
ncbi:phage head-tail joining protein, partial [Lacticaseibacillus paracasei]